MRFPNFRPFLFPSIPLNSQKTLINVRNVTSTVAQLKEYSDASSDTSHFGFQTVPREAKKDLVKDVFDSVANDYDLMNDIMSGSLHRIWKDNFVKILRPECLVHLPNTPDTSNLPARILDVAGGTGDIAFRICDSISNSKEALSENTRDVEVVVCDINASMLDVGRKRAAARCDAPGTSLSWLEANAEDLHMIPDSSVDAYTIAFGIRNVTDIPQALREAHRVLRPGGRFMCLEFSKIQGDPTGLLQKIYESYSFNVIPSVGAVVTGDRDSYQYLVESIIRFPSQEEFVAMVEDAGFSQVTYKNLTFGVVAAHSAFKI
eukprot:g295.t1